MATKKKNNNQILKSRMLTAALSLGILAAAGMIGMYTVGKSEEKKKEEQKEEQEQLAREQAEAQTAYEEAVREAASSGDVVAQFEKEVEWAPELESDFVISEQETLELPPEEQAESIETSVATYDFSPETDHLIWPIAGNIILDYSMDRTVYFITLDQYKYHPAIMIQGHVGQEVLCGADGKVDRIEKSDELGYVVRVDFGSGYEGIYGQLTEITVEEGSLVQPGVKLGVVSEPTYYYSKEGPNVYFQVLKDGQPVDPKDLLQ